MYNKKQIQIEMQKVDSSLAVIRKNLREADLEQERILQMFKTKEINYSQNILTGVSNLVGRTIKRIVPASSGWGEYSNFLLIECEDGQRICISGRDSCNMPTFEPDEMIKTGFYTKEEIQKTIDSIERKKLSYEKDELKRKEEKLKRLQKELNK